MGRCSGKGDNASKQKQRRLASRQQRRQLVCGGTGHRGEQEQPLEDLVLVRLDWLVCSAGSELALEVEVVEAQASVLWPQSDRVSFQEDIVEAATLLEELWDLTEHSSPVGSEARLVFAARLLRALKQQGRAVCKTVPVAAAAPPVVQAAAPGIDTWVHSSGTGIGPRD